MKQITFTLFLAFQCFMHIGYSQIDTLKPKIEALIKGKQSEVGVSVYGIESKEALNINGSKHFPTMSVYKFHIALAILNQVDKKTLSLDKKIHIKESELLPDIYSPLKTKYPSGDIDIPLCEILSYTVSLSDGNGCDILLRLIGGAKVVERYIHSIGIKEVSIKATEEEMHKNWDVQFTNWTTPIAAVQLLNKFYERKILSKKSFDFMWKIMTETSTGKNRIKGQLPAGTMVAHKTGSSGANEQGLTVALNDIGIVTLPNGKHFSISIFITNSKENDVMNEKIIADITKSVWDYFVSKEK